MPFEDARIQEETLEPSRAMQGESNAESVRPLNWEPLSLVH